MKYWEIVYQPSSGENYSVEDYIDSLKDNEQARLENRFYTIEQTKQFILYDWIKKINDVYQVSHGDHRFYFGIDDKTLVFVYACRKQSRKAKKKDFDRADRNFANYMKEKKT